VSVRAAILALGRFGIADRPMVKALEKKWKHYKKDKGLDNYGHQVAAGTASPDAPAADECLHTPDPDLS
jgi:hypothetical protein